MKKSLLIVIAALFVAIGASAQGNLLSHAKKIATPMTPKMEMKKASDTDVVKFVTPKANAGRRAAGDIEGTYILDYANWEGDFTTSSTFTITAETGTAKVLDSDDEGNEIEKDFEYNIRLNDFTFSGGVAYAFYDEENATIQIPAQVIVASYSTYGRIIFAGLVTKEGAPYNFGFDMLFEVDSDGTLYNYDFSEELAAAGWPEGCAITGFYDYLPDYGSGQSYIEIGTTAEVFPANAIQGGVEVHIESGAWGSWTRQSHMTFVEDYGSEIVVHNFFGLCPISITIEGDKASIATPVRVMDSDYADEGEEPNYIMINQWDENFENILNPGLITGNVTVDTDGTKYIEFYDTEYKEAWTDESGEHEAGNYIINDYTKWFMVHSTWGDNGAYWWGEARNVYVAIPNAGGTGISNVKTTAKNGVKTYNLMGQEVNPSAKGLIIRDGKKMLNK
jgi:hypothetical protein